MQLLALASSRLFPEAAAVTDSAEDPDFSALLRQHRLSAHLTQEALAERAGLSARTVQDLERGVARPLRGTARRLADALALHDERRAQFDRIAAPAPRARRAGRGLTPRQADAPAGDVGDGPGGQADLGGERRQVTVLVAEVVGATDSLQSLELDVADRLLTRAVPLIVEVVQRCGGTVNRVDGDGIMALFGAPRAREDDAVRACAAALALHEAFDRFAMRISEECGVRLTLRIGLASGDVILRRTGSGPYRECTALGPAVRAAIRLGQVASGGSALLTAETLRLAEGYIDARPVGPVSGIGPVGSAESFELIGGRPERTRFQRVVGTRQLSRFVGRDSELASLTSALGRARDGHGQIVALVGEPGVGKSRLIWEVTRSARTGGWSVLESGAVSHGPVSEYRPAIDLVKSYCRIEARDDGTTIRERLTERISALDRALASDLPALLSLLDVPVQDAAWGGLDPPQRRRRMLDAVRRLLLRESHEQPLLLVLEDLHWIDSETQALLDALVESIPAARILLMVSYRPEYEHHWVRKTYYSQLRVDALPTASANELLGALLGEDPGLQPLKQTLITKTEGNPLFLEESIRSLVEAGALVGERGAYHPVGPINTVRVPDTVQAVLAARIDRLDPEAKRLLQLTAVIGKDVPFSLLRAIVDAPDEQLQGTLARLFTTELLYEANLFPEPHYTFKHVLTQDVAYGSLLQDRRQALHAQVARAIERLYPERPAAHVERLAHHALRGELWEQAVAACREAGQRSLARSANHQAVAHFEQALAALEHLDQAPDRIRDVIDLRLQLSAALTPLGDLQRISQTMDEADRLAVAIGDERRRALIATYLVSCGYHTGDRDGAVRAGRRALAIAERLNDVVLKVAATYHLAQAASFFGDFREGAELARRNLTSLTGEQRHERLGTPAISAVMSGYTLSVCLAQLGRFDESLEAANEAIRLADAVQHPYSQTVGLASGHTHLVRGAPTDAARWFERGLELCRTADVGMMMPILATYLGHAWILSGLAREAVALLEPIHVRLASSGYLRQQMLVMIGLAEAYLAVGDFKQALGHVQRVLTRSEYRPFRGNLARALLLRAEIAARREPPEIDQGEPDFREALGAAEGLGMRPLQTHCHLGLGKLYRRTGRIDEARAELTAAVAMLRDMGMVYWLPEAEAELTRAGGSVSGNM